IPLILAGEDPTLGAMGSGRRSVCLPRSPNPQTLEPKPFGHYHGCGRHRAGASLCDGRRQHPLALGRATFLETLGALARPFSLPRRPGQAAVDRPPATAGIYAGLFVITPSTLMYEVLLRRVF